MRLRQRASAAALLLLPLFCLGCPSSSAQQASDCSSIEAAWKSIKPYPYVWGGESAAEGGFDCSGAIYHVQKTIGQPVPRTTAKKYFIMAAGPETSWKNAGCGWWVWWQFSPGRPYGHIGMHTERPHAWQSGSSTGPDRIKFFEGGFWDKRFKTSRNPYSAANE